MAILLGLLGIVGGFWTCRTLGYEQPVSIRDWSLVLFGAGSAASLVILARSGRQAGAQSTQAGQSENALRKSCEDLTQLLERRSAEIRRQEEELADLFHSATVGLHILGADGTILNANRAELELLGRTSEEYVGQNIAQFHADRANCAALLQRLNTLKPVENLPAQLRHKDGSIRHVLIDAKPRLKDGCFLHALCFTRDVTERAWVGDKMFACQREASHLKTAMDEHSIVAITDPCGRIIYVNDRFCALSKFSRDELIGQDHRIMNSRYHPPEFMEDLWTTISSGKVWKGEIKNRAKDGAYFWVDTTIVPFLGEDGQPMQHFAIHADITPRKQAQLRIETISERLRLATQGSGIGIWDWDLGNNTLIWDEIMYRLYGLDPTVHPALSKAWERALHPDDRDRARNEIENSIRDNQTYDTFFRVIWPGGAVRHIRAHAIVQRDETGKAIRMTGTNWDITDHRVAEEKLATSLHEKEVLLKEIHHRVKNNMQVVYSLLSLQSAQITDPEALKAFRESQDRVQSMALLHEKLYQSQNLARIDFAGYLGSLLDHLFSSFGPTASHIERVIDVPGVSLGLDTAIPCGLIVSELVSNALKYAFVGRTHGQVQLRMTSDAEGYYHLWVQDDGVGLPKDLEFRNATSLGLQLVNMLTLQLHGEVDCRNGSGTQFHITFQDPNLKLTK